MSKVKVHAGDYQGTGSCGFGVITMPWQPGDGFSLGKAYSFSEIDTVEPASEEAAIRLGGAVGWGAVGGVILGPVGLLAGLLLGGKGKDVTFIARFKDGKKILATTDAGTYKKLLAAVF